jgi:hypothetical protein
MYIKLQTEDQPIYGLVHIDVNGNVYIDISYYKDNFDQSSYIYQICVDNDNHIYCDLHDYYVLNDNKVNKGKFYNYNKMEELEEKNDETDEEEEIDEKETEEEEKEEDTDDDTDDEEEEKEDNKNLYDLVDTKYYYEEKDTCFFLNLEETDESYFSFYDSGLNTGIDVSERENGEVLSLYDTMLYESNNNIFRSKLIGDPSFYILKLFDDGRVRFRELIDINSENEYIISIDRSGNIEFTKQ